MSLVVLKSSCWWSLSFDHSMSVLAFTNYKIWPWQTLQVQSCLQTPFHCQTHQKEKERVRGHVKAGGIHWLCHHPKESGMESPSEGTSHHVCLRLLRDQGGKNEFCPGNSHGSFQDRPWKEVESVTGNIQAGGRQGGPGKAMRVLRPRDGVDPGWGARPEWRGRLYSGAGWFGSGGQLLFVSRPPLQKKNSIHSAENIFFSFSEFFFASEVEQKQTIY